MQPGADPRCRCIVPDLIRATGGFGTATAAPPRDKGACKGRLEEIDREGAVARPAYWTASSPIHPSRNCRTIDRISIKCRFQKAFPAGEMRTGKFSRECRLPPRFAHRAAAADRALPQSRTDAGRIAFAPGRSGGDPIIIAKWVPLSPLRYRLAEQRGARCRHPANQLKRQKFGFGACAGTAIAGSQRPLILKPKTWPVWLGEEPADVARLKSMLGPYPSEEMTCWPVSQRVGSVKNNDATLIEPMSNAAE
jgi:hypothetical protein